ncbi:hypothetical protein CC78DRAFT_538869 [Lojkania enalia]|uniref:Uncharacterized protein n=1 Tax=Lojkania enalia TaxID=147567 RepID=A0A9P4TS14_9PLEO|nr:hypothetical protein CC78DRAFT_538869 [Didymosphaeria enalia]
MHTIYRLEPARLERPTQLGARRVEHLSTRSTCTICVQICHDLETRCENVEEPLRREENKVRDSTTQEIGGLSQEVEKFNAEIRKTEVDKAVLGQNSQILSTKYKQIEFDLQTALRNED